MKVDKDSSFSRMSKYKESENKTQTENFTTELFVFIILYLINNKDKLVYKLLNEFGFIGEIDLNKFSIQSQCSMTVGKKKVIPDMLMEYNNKRIIIEVKIDSELNEYQLDKKSLNQLELYSKIRIDNNDIDGIYLLTKRIIDIDNSLNNKIKNRIFWSKIYSLLENSNDFIVGLFLDYLEENGMAPKELNGGIFDALDSLSCLTSLIQESFPLGKYRISKFGYSKKEGWFGCSIKKEEQDILWMGINGGDDIYVHIQKGLIKQDKGLAKKIATKIIPLAEDWIFEQIALQKIITAKTYEKQKELLQKWFKKIIDKTEKYVIARSS
jgi:hypothetical protein